MARPRIEISGFEQTIDGIIEEVRIDTEDEAIEIGQEMVQEVEQLVRAKFNNDRHKINTTRLENSFKYEVEQDGDGWEVYLTIKPGVSSGKVGALNNGRSGASKGYKIVPRNVPRALEFNPFNRAKYEASGGVIATSGPYAGRAFKPQASRDSAGASEGHFFMEEARDIVLRRRGYA